MPKTLFLPSCLSLLLCLSGYAQTAKNDASFYSVDNAARTIHYKTDIYRLTRELTDPYTEQILKVRAIFIWITENIGYNYKFINKGREIKMPDCEGEANCEEQFLEWENRYLVKVIKKKCAICDGYARLFKKMCDIAGIRCEIVAGYTRAKPYQVGNTGSLNHAWNAVWVDSAWHFLDPTWAAGGCVEDEETGKLLRFNKKYDDYFWFTPFKDLSRDHYPKDGKWVFEPNYTKEAFAANPYYASDIITSIKLLSPASGIVKARQGDTIHFKFSYKYPIEGMQINSNVFRNPDIWQWEKKPWHRKRQILDSLALKKQVNIPFTRNLDVYEFDYVVTDASLYYLDILFDRERAMRFNVGVEKKKQ